MNDQRVKTDTETIAEFMGYYNEEWWRLNKHEFNPEKSWDDLMPVVEKINRGGYEHDGFVLKMAVKNAVSDVDIKVAFRYVVQFIHWYQKQKSS